MTMRIALFSGNYNYLKEGANQALNRLVRYLEEERGHRVRVYSPVTDTPAFIPAGTLVPVPSVALPVRSEFRLAMGLPRAIRQDIAGFRPDIIHVSTPDILDTRAQSFAIGRNIPVVASQHSRFEAYLDYYRLGWARGLIEAHLRRFYRRSDHVLAPTPALMAQMAALRGDDRVSLWGRGVDSLMFDPARRDMAWRRAQGLADDDIAILFFGRLVLEKGIAMFVESVRALQDRNPHVRPLIVGAGPAADAFAPLDRVLFAGHLQDEALARAVASADILLHPSLTEAFGNVVLEAMASGLAVVSTDSPSSAMLIRDGKSGILCPPQDAAAMAAAVEALIADPGRRRALGMSARRASRAHGWNAASQSVEHAYRSVLDRRAHAA
ncbi:glycosyltransferase family 1 protein [Sphingobium aquiterrae]|uniref:glycosyltransferase family 4 protein n=1 Tax=Sphingobium aquiterrae TaxID=2038656 RepID=UPI00301B5303